MTPPSSSRPVHPTARAFFLALDNRTSSDVDSSVATCGTSNTRQSDKIRKQSQTLGWRSRHSQSELYPFSVCSSSTQKTAQLHVRQVQRGEVEGTYGTGATVWPASMVLLKYLEKHPLLVSGKTVVDLGAGTGITSIAAAVLGASHVVCTDGTTSVVQLAQENVNQTTVDIASHITVREYSWGDEGCFAPNETFDVVLVSDCVLPKLYPIAPLRQALNDLLSHQNSVAILSYEHRHFAEYDPRDKFRELATEKGLCVEVVPMSEQDPIYSVDDIEIWIVRRLS